MSIVSHAFGRVQLTDSDAKKFKNQVTYGRPKVAAKQALETGLKLSDALGRTGKIKLAL